MEFGQAIIWIGFLGGIGAFLAYMFGSTASPLSANLARRLFYLMTGSVLAASALLFSYIFTHQFRFKYVAEYTSRSQALPYLISAFWAGQEGTFLLWAVFTTVMGLVFMKSSRTPDRHAMGIVSAFGAFLLLLMIAKSPFALSPSILSDGAGMNPLLQDPWMVIHPPILFIGYAASLFPFALVLSGLFRRNFSHWLDAGFSWTLFSALTLGAGIIIGGFWAYEVLGWGGYWGWDPVENSSLVPWLTILALIHGMLVQKQRGSLFRTNLLLAILSFVLVLYATFLTRSGVLSDFSVHSFVDLGISSYLIGVLAAAAIVGFGLFAARFRSIAAPKIDTSSLNREVGLVAGLWALCAGAAFTFVGMSSPIFTRLFGSASQVETSFYNMVNLPVAIVIALLLGVTPFLGWSEDKKSGFLKRLTMPFALSALSCAIAYVAGVQSAALMIFVGSASFALISNTVVVFRLYRSGWMALGGPAAHIGLALLLIGIVGSGVFDRTEQVLLKQGQSASVLGYELNFRGVAAVDAAKPQMKIEVSDGRSMYLATPRLYYSSYNQATMREPDIKIYPLHDLYLSPVEMRSAESAGGGMKSYELVKGETKEIEGYKITFARFDMGRHGESEDMSVGAVLDVDADGARHEVVPSLAFSGGGERKAVPAEMPPLHHADLPPAEGSRQVSNMPTAPEILLNAISVEDKKITVQLDGARQSAQRDEAAELVVEVSTKPLMMVVWTGVVLIILGTAMAFRQRIARPAEN